MGNRITQSSQAYRAATRPPYCPTICVAGSGFHLGRSAILTNPHYLAEKAEDAGLLIRPLCCESCNKPKLLVRHHPDYSMPFMIMWLCYVCHKKEHARNVGLRNPYNNGTKLIRIDATIHRKLQMEAFRQSGKKDTVVTMGDVISQLAIQLTKKRRRK